MVTQPMRPRSAFRVPLEGMFSPSAAPAVCGLQEAAQGVISFSKPWLIQQSEPAVGQPNLQDAPESSRCLRLCRKHSRSMQSTKQHAADVPQTIQKGCSDILMSHSTLAVQSKHLQPHGAA